MADGVCQACISTSGPPPLSTALTRHSPLPPSAASASTPLPPALCYFGVSLLGFRAFGTSVGENVLLAFEHGPTHWVVTMANAMVVVHVAAAYQVGGAARSLDSGAPHTRGSKA